MTTNIINDNKGLVISIAKRYQGKGLDMEDLIQEGYIGLLRATKDFDSMLGVKFSTYASNWIRAFIVRAIENTGSLIRIPSNKNNLASPSFSEVRDNNSSDSYSEVNTNHLVSTIKSIINNDLDFNMYLDYYINDLSYRDMSKKYNISHETVRTKLTLTQNLIKSKLTK